LGPTKEHLSVGACGSSGGENECEVSSSRHRLVYNIEKDFKEIGGESLVWMYLDQNGKTSEFL